MTVKQYKACLFDMDGLLINSEDIYTKSFSKVLIENFGKEQGLTWDVKVKLQGLQGPDACQVVLDSYQLNDVTTNMEFLRLTSEEQEKLWHTVQFLPGASELIQYLHSRNIPMALCTSSSYDKFLAKTSHLQEFKLFGDKVVTGDDPEVTGKGKPLPYVWWTGLSKINKGRSEENAIKAEECLVFEDAVLGFISGKRSNGYVIWVPDVRAVEVMEQDQIDELVGPDNKHGTLLKSLEEFQPASYGL
ncbi:hypothetical protein FOA43_001264 [Brettanomyces nanus]|uniref:Uncharacterized protein n=1 Tax=Eeniella nana TaxID=13502 RepID=A0A875S289_EENNA|nr:uncharacterized protein FOA43_001264 [Brettanomyces nanus]QPG73949.1 hypothetical protein FOA43_001264 [Brettanomyces nanus]